MKIYILSTLTGILLIFLGITSLATTIPVTQQYTVIRILYNTKHPQLYAVAFAYKSSMLKSMGMKKGYIPKKQCLTKYTNEAHTIDMNCIELSKLPKNPKAYYYIPPVAIPSNLRSLPHGNPIPSIQGYNSYSDCKVDHSSYNCFRFFTVSSKKDLSKKLQIYQMENPP